MPFVRFSRDKRGYEYVYLMDVPGRQSKGAQPRMLYWFRTPPGLKVGREPFDKAAQQALESRYPELTFDWKQIKETPKPAPDAGAPWRERRRLERAAKRARTVEGPRDADESAGDDESQERDRPEPSPTDDEGAVEHPALREEQGAASEGENVPAVAQPSLEAAQASPGAVPQGKDAAGRRRRRRRRGGRGRHKSGERPLDLAPGAGGTADPVQPASVEEMSGESEDGAPDESGPDDDNDSRDDGNPETGG